MAKKKKGSARRKARLESGKKWVETYKGKDILKDYSKHYRVKILRAIEEVPLLGIKLDSGYLKKVKEERRENIKKQRENKKLQIRVNKARKEREDKLKSQFYEDFYSDETFSFIAGYTSGGVPYGIRWDEKELYYSSENVGCPDEDDYNPFETDIVDVCDEDDIPF